MSARRASVVRTTDQAEVKVVFDLDGSGSGIARTGAPFLDHLLVMFARHGAFDLEVQCRRHDALHDLAEEVGACLGVALDKALGDKQGICRLGYCCAPVEEHLARAVVEVSGHPCLVYHVHAQTTPRGGLESVDVERFWRAFADQARLNLHIEILYGAGGLPGLEAVFKAAAHALSDACREYR